MVICYNIQTTEQEEVDVVKTNQKIIDILNAEIEKLTKELKEEDGFFMVA